MEAEWRLVPFSLLHSRESWCKKAKMDFKSLDCIDEPLGGTVRKELQDSLWSHPLSGSAIECDGLDDLPSAHTVGNAIRLALGLPGRLAIRFRGKPQAWPFCEDPSQSVTGTSSRSCLICGFGRPMTSRVRHGNSASRLPASKLTPAKKSAQIISRQ